MEEKKDNLNKELEKHKQQAEEYLNGWKRAKADLINYQKDEVKRFESIAKFANEAIAQDLLNVLDSFDLAISALEKENKLDKGVYMIKSQLENVLKKYGLEKLVVSIGQKFDPSLQEAIVAAESDKESGTVVEEIETGYTLHGKLIRAAKVKVAK